MAKMYVPVYVVILPKGVVFFLFFLKFFKSLAAPQVRYSGLGVARELKWAMLMKFGGRHDLFYMFGFAYAEKNTHKG